MSAGHGNNGVGHGNNGTLVRYFAASFVVVQHSFMLAGEPDPVAGTGRFRHIGYIGVLMFFALSGFLLTRRIKIDPLPYFVSSRVFRILPLLIAVNLLTVVLGAFYTTLSLREYFAPDAFGFVWNNIFSFGQQTLPGVTIGPHSADGLNQAMNIAQWSIFYEMRCYVLLVALAIFGVISARGALAVFVLLVVFLQPVQGTWLAFGDWRAAEMTATFLFGALFAQERLTMDWKWILGFVAMAVWTDLVRLPFSGIAFDFALSAITVALAFGAVPYARAFDHMPDLTYPLYLCHWPVALVMTSLVTLPGWQLALSVLAITIAVSIPLHYIVEEPFRKIPRWLAKPRTKPTPVAAEAA